MNDGQASDYVVATYLLHGAKGDLRKRAESIAVGLTVGSWTDLPTTRQEKMRDRLGVVMRVEELEPSATGERKTHIAIGYPIQNFTADIPALLTTIFGKLSMDGKIRLVDLALPAAFEARFPGPRFGIDGIRAWLGVRDRPLLMSIFKSCLGFEAKQLGELFYAQAVGGVDFVKDDEIFFDESAASFSERIKACGEAAERAAQVTGKRTKYAVNLTGPVTELMDKAERGVEAGANCFLLNVLAYGYDVLHRLAENSRITVPIMAHPALAGAFFPSTMYGIAPEVLLGKLMRLSGADFVLYPSPYGSVAMPREEAMGIADALRVDNDRLRRAWPVPSAGIHPGLVLKLYRDLGDDQVINAGGGVHGHPGGTTAGAKAFADAIDAVVHGEALRQAAGRSPELEAALKLWGEAI